MSELRTAASAARSARILAALEASRGDVEIAAESLGIKRRALYHAIGALALGETVAALRDRLGWTPVPGRRLGRIVPAAG